MKFNLLYVNNNINNFNPLAMSPNFDGDIKGRSKKMITIEMKLKLLV